MLLDLRFLSSSVFVLAAANFVPVSSLLFPSSSVADVVSVLRYFLATRVARSSVRFSLAGFTSPDHPHRLPQASSFCSRFRFSSWSSTVSAGLCLCLPPVSWFSHAAALDLVVFFACEFKARRQDSVFSYSSMQRPS
jgi:hypothetical protein